MGCGSSAEVATAEGMEQELEFHHFFLSFSISFIILANQHDRLQERPSFTHADDVLNADYLARVRFPRRAPPTAANIEAAIQNYLDALHGCVVTPLKTDITGTVFKVRIVSTQKKALSSLGLLG